MDDARFDRIARLIASTGTRRAFLRLVAGTAGVAAVPFAGARRLVAADDCRVSGDTCASDGECCAGWCDAGICADPLAVEEAEPAEPTAEPVEPTPDLPPAEPEPTAEPAASNLPEGSGPSTADVIEITDDDWSQFGSCSDCDSGWCDDVWLLTLSTRRAVTFSIEDCCIAGDYYELWIDGLFAGQTPMVTYYGSTYSKADIHVVLPAGTHQINVRDGAFRSYPDLCAAGVWFGWTLGEEHACDPGETDCDGFCRDLTSDPENCGACGFPCSLVSANMICDGSACICKAGYSFCAGACVNTATSKAHCGRCGNPCPAGYSCREGQCRPPKPKIIDGPRVKKLTPTSAVFTWKTDLPASTRVYVGLSNPPQTLKEKKEDSDPANYKRTHELTVTRGLYPGRTNYWRVESANETGPVTSKAREVVMDACGAGLSPCGDRCRNLATDEDNCGTCGTKCAEGQKCINKKCKTTTAEIDVFKHKWGDTVPFISQYPPDWSRTQDCGAACGANIVQYFDLRPSDVPKDVNFLTQFRKRATGGVVENRDLNFTQLIAGFKEYGLSATAITTRTASTPSKAVDQMITALKAGQPLVAIVQGGSSPFNRRTYAQPPAPTCDGKPYPLATCKDPDGKKYAGHFVVVRGISADRKTIYLSDPDERTPDMMKCKCRLAEWLNGGAILAVSRSEFEQAMADALSQPGQGIQYALAIKKA